MHNYECVTDVPLWVPVKHKEKFKLFLTNNCIVSSYASEYALILKEDMKPVKCEFSDYTVSTQYSKGVLELNGRVKYNTKILSCSIKGKKTIVKFKEENISFIEEIKNNALYLLGGIVIGVILTSL